MKHYLLLFVFCLSTSIYSQDLINKVPAKAPFVMSINGKNLNDKVTVKTIQDYPWMQTFLEKQFKDSSKDLSQTGIDFANKQYQYYINKDSVKSYVLLLPLTNSQLFEKFIQTKNGDSIQVQKRASYSTISTSKSNYLAWNDKYAVMVYGSYSKLSKYTDDYAQTDIDAAADYEPEPVADPAVDYAQETEVIIEEPVAPPPPPAKTKSKKGKKKTKEVVTPVIEVVEPTEEEIYAAQDKAYAEEMEISNKLAALKQKETDSIEKIRISASVDLIFNEAFNSTAETSQVNPEILKKLDPKSDIFVWADLDAITHELYSSFGILYSALTKMNRNEILNKSGILESSYTMNGYFEKDKMRLNQVISPKTAETKKLFGEMFDSKMDKKLLNYLGENVLAYYSISMNTEAIIKYEYSILRSTLNGLYKTYSEDANADNVDVLIDALEIFLDEKAIAEILPGNGIFILHDLKSVKKEFITYGYDDEYNPIETKGIKDELTPDFTFVFSTKNESFVNKLLRMPLNKNKFTATDYQETNGYYTIHFEKDNILENLYLGLKNGVVMITTSKQNMENLVQQNPAVIRPDFKKAISKNASSAWLDLQKITLNSKTGLKEEDKGGFYDIALKNAGEIAMESKFKNGAIIIESTYSIRGEHENSLQYFFNVINESYLEGLKEKTTTEE